MSDIAAISSVAEKPSFLVAQADQAGGASNRLLIGPGEAPAAEDVTRFENLLGPGKAEPLTGSEAPLNAPVVEAAQKSGGLGDAILGGIDKMSASYQQKVDAVNTTISSGGAEGMTSADIMQLQFELAQMSMMQDLTAKVADKTSQGIQTLFKNQ